MGFWEALDTVDGDTLQQRCWIYRMVKIQNCLPMSLQLEARQALSAIWQIRLIHDMTTSFEGHISRHAVVTLPIVSSARRSMHSPLRPTRYMP